MATPLFSCDPLTMQTPITAMQPGHASVAIPPGSVQLYRHSGTHCTSKLGICDNPETVTISGYNAAYTLNWTPLSTPSLAAPLTTVPGTCTSGLGAHLPWTNPVTDGSLSAISTLKLQNTKSFSFTYDPPPTKMTILAYLGGLKPGLF